MHGRQAALRKLLVIEPVLSGNLLFVNAGVKDDRETIADVSADSVGIVGPAL
jgi:hypothetical protein